jgi:hypothetical protein
LKPSFGDQATFFKSSRNNLYSYIQHGGTSKQFFLSYCAMNENPATRSQSLSTII